MDRNRGRGINFQGFQFKKASAPEKSFSMNAVPPPQSLSQHSGRRNNAANSSSGANPGPAVNKSGYSSLETIAQFANSSHYAVGSSKKRGFDEDDYFDQDVEEPEMAYLPAPGSPGPGTQQNKNNDGDEESEDELDAFMSMINEQVQKEQTKAPEEAPKAPKGSRGDIDDEDDEESYYRYMEENPNAGLQNEDNSDNEIEYDEDGNPIAPPRKRDIDPLPPIDHTEIEYEPFEKNFYTEHEDIAALDSKAVNELRDKLGIKIMGPSPPAPVTSFAHFGFDENLMKVIRKQEFSSPLPIQSQAIPAALGGRDIIGIAKTGSGKTAAFLWPALVHIMDQKPLQEGDGPIALILAPTRELSIQIYNEAKKFGKVYNIHVVCAYGGGSKWEQSKALEGGAEIVVATPGRMIDLVKMKATNLRRVTYLVLDEADKMFNMGFEPQVRSICNHVRPDRQTLLFSATFKKRIEKLARDVLTDPIKIIQGDVGQANEDVTQKVLIFNNPLHKWNWLLMKLVEFLSEGSVLIFVTKKAEAEKVAHDLGTKEFEVCLLHGDIEQAERNKVITRFKKREVDIMVATDVASRGLDIPHIRTVINYDIARDIDTHTHRIGRTGRSGEKGTAYTFVSDKDKEFVGHLVRNLESANQEVPQNLMDLAMQSSWFKSSRFKQGRGKAINIGGAGLGFREKQPRNVQQFQQQQQSQDQTSSEPSSGTNNGASGAGSTGSPMNRLNAMKEAFRRQYSSNFKVGADRSWEQVQTQPTFTVPNLPPPPPPPPSSLSAPSSAEPTSAESANKKQKKSRWN